MLRHRSFWVILFITALVGGGTLFSEHNDYPMDLHIEWVGYDTARYSIVHADTVLPVTLNSNCFLAISRYYKAPKMRYSIHTKGDTVVNVNKILIDAILSDFEFVGIHGSESTVDRLVLKLAPRQSKSLRPELRGVELQFEGQCGLAGEPRLDPDMVTLYGSESSLAGIEHLYTLPQTIAGLKDTCVCTLSLDPVWQKHPDLRVSAENVRLFIPVERFTEKKFSVPVQFETTDNQVRARLYPERVDVTLWVSERDYDKVLPDMVQASVQYDAADLPEALSVRVKSFPSYTRVKSVFPSTIQYVILK